MKFLQEKKIKRLTALSSEPQWVIQSISQGSAPFNFKSNALHVGWPTMDQIIYPGQTGRINTGVTSTQIGAGLTSMTIPQKTLLQNGLMSFPQIIDATDPRNGSQIVQIVQNTNKFPVKIQYERQGQVQFGPQQQLPGPRITRLDPDTLQQVQLLQDIDWGSLLSQIVTIASVVLPIFL